MENYVIITDSAADISAVQEKEWDTPIIKMSYLLNNTLYVNNPDHAWNIVRIGGHYFHADSTWNDEDKINRDNFLKSDQQFIAHGGSHAEWEANIPSSLHTFQKEGTPECKYQIGDVNTDGTISVADIVKMSRYLLGAEPIVMDDYILYDLNYDSNIDVYDMIYMRKLFLNVC